MRKKNILSGFFFATVSPRWSVTGKKSGKGKAGGGAGLGRGGGRGGEKEAAGKRKWSLERRL